MDFHVAVPGPFTYLVHEHARSIIAIQELQQEVTSLLEFRDNVLEALPHLHTRPFHSLTPQPTHDPPAAPQPTHTTTASPSKASDGGRRGMSAGGGGGSSSSSGGKSLSETHSSAVADSGFSTDKAGGSMGKSSSSSAGEHLSGAEEARWTSVDPDLPLGSAEDELWHLLDVIQRKGTKLRQELERAERCERDKLSSSGRSAPLHHPHSAASSPASDPITSNPHPAKNYWPHSLPDHTLLPPPPPPVVGLETEAWAAVDRLRQDRQYLIGRVGWAEAEAAASHQKLVDLHGQLLALAGDKRRLEDQIRALRLDAAVVQGHGSGGIGSALTTDPKPRRPPPAVTVSIAGQEGEDGATRRPRSASTVRLNTDRDVVLPRVLKVPIKDKSPRPSSTTRDGAEDTRGSDRVVIERERRPGRADGGFSMPVSLLKGAKIKVTPNKQRISAILREKDVLELQRQLLTSVMEVEVLRKQVETASEEWTTKTSEWEADHRVALSTVTTLKEENSKLKQQLEEKDTKEGQKDVSVSACPVMHSTGTMTTKAGQGQEEEAPTHTVHAGPNVKYDVVVHEERRTENGAVRRGAVIEKPPRKSREPRNASSPAPVQRESLESPGGRDSIGLKGVRGKGVSQSGRCTPTSTSTPRGTPRSSPAPSITPRICTNRTHQQDTPRTSHLTRTSSGGPGRSTLTRKDSIRTRTSAVKNMSPTTTTTTGASPGASPGASGHQKIAPTCNHQNTLGQPRPMRPTLQSPQQDHTAHARTTSSRGRVGSSTGVLQCPGAGDDARKWGGAAGDLKHTPSPTPSSSEDYYDSINTPYSASPSPTPVMQVEVAFEWSPVTPQQDPIPRKKTLWYPSSQPQGSCQNQVDSLERGTGRECESTGHGNGAAGMVRRYGAGRGSERGNGKGVEKKVVNSGFSTAQGMTGLGRRESVREGTRGNVTPLVRERPKGSGTNGVLANKDQDLNTRVHQILSRIASGAH